MSVEETPIEEWLTSRKGREYAVLKGPGGGTVFRKGDETIDQARARRAVQQEAKRRERAAAKDQGHPAAQQDRPRGKGRKQDPTPGPSNAEPKQPPPKPKVTVDQLAASVEVPLSVFGAFFGRMILECDYCAGQMAANAGKAARDLANTSNPYLLSILGWWHAITAGVAGSEGLIAYFGPPVVHHALPAPMAAVVSPIMGVPPRQPRDPQQQHDHSSGVRRPGQSPASPAAGPPNGPGSAGNAPAQGAPGNGQPSPREMELMRQRAELEARLARSRHASPNVPPYNARNGERAPGTPTAPPTSPADSAGDPLPPEAYEIPGQ